MSTDEGYRPTEYQTEYRTEYPPTRLTARQTSRPRGRRLRPSRRTPLRRHLRCALVGTLLAIVAITGLSAYAAQGIADARQNALCQAHISCK